MKQLFITSLILLGIASCSNPQEAIKAYQQQKEAIGLQTPEKQNELLGQNPVAFQQNLQAISKQYAEVLANIKGLPSDFIAKEQKENQYELLALTSAYLLNHRKYTQEEAPAINTLEESLKDVDLDNATDFDAYDAYRTLVHNCFQLKIYRYQVQYEFNDPWGKILADFNTLKSQNIKETLAPLLIEGVSATSAETTNEQIIALVQKVVKDEELLNTLSTRIATVNQLKAGQPFPTLPSLIDLNGKEVKYESLPLKNKLLFVDIWATYCPDCRKEIPALEALQQNYKGKPIVFVSISVDRDKETWKEMVKNDKLSGMHLYADAETKLIFKQLYDLRSIPRYMLINAQGNIINSNAPMPSDSHLKELIDSQLLQIK
ncbi:hypothetical protein RCZ04_00880 [Capnocytophaga sp. HP1101]